MTFDINGFTKKEHNLDLVHNVNALRRHITKLKAANYYHKALHLGCCCSPRSASAYNGKTGRRLIETTDQQIAKDKSSYMYQHFVYSYHALVNLADLTIFNFEYKHNKYKRNNSETRYNKQDTSVPLKLLNWDLFNFGFYFDINFAKSNRVSNRRDSPLINYCLIF